MISHYVKTAIRFLLRNPWISVINITGLAIGLAVFILIMLYVRNELRYDKFNENLDSVCRYERISEDSESAWTTSAMGLDIQEAIPEIVSFVRFKHWTDMYLDYGEKKYNIPNIALVDSTFFDLFSLEMVKGNPKTALVRPLTAVITESMAAIIFGEEDPVGKVLRFSGGTELEITGLIKDPENFHIQLDMLASFVSLGQFYGQDHLHNYRTYQYMTYFKLAPQVTAEIVNPKVDEFMHKKLLEMYGEEYNTSFRIWLRPMREVYFARNVRDYGAVHGNYQFVIIFSIIAVMIIVIACINFVNISTARAAQRAREVGMKKVVGASRKKLIYQFLGESVIISFLAMIIGMLLVKLVLPTYNQVISADLGFNWTGNLWIVLLLLGGIVLVGLFAGIYPALFLTGFKPVNVLKGEWVKGKGGGFLRKALIFFQFTITIFLIIGTFVVYRQLGYVRNKDKGFETEKLITLELNRDIFQSLERFKQGLLSDPRIEKVAYSYTAPGGGDNYEGFSLGEKGLNPVVYSIDPDYIETLGMTIVKGRNFSWKFPHDSLNTCILNEQAVKELDMDPDSLIGKKFDHPSWYITAFPRTQFEIIGIVKDFHFKSLKQPIEPLMFGWNEDWFSYVNIRIKGGDIPATLEHIEREWKKISPQYPFEYTFMDDRFDRMYRSEQRLGKIFTWFAALAIFIAMLGLFGLAAYMAGRRTREIGIRKVQGASVSGIVLLLVREFILLIIISSVVAWPIAWFAASRWLQEFEYRISLGIGLFILSTLIALIITMVTVISQTLKTANTNPAEALRYE